MVEKIIETQTKRDNYLPNQSNFIFNIFSLNFPISLAAAPREPLEQNTFLQTCALPAPFVEFLHSNGIDRSLIRSVAQWRLDFPLPHSNNESLDYGNVLAVAEAQLTRGTTPFCFPSLESFIKHTFNWSEDFKMLVNAMRCVALSPLCQYYPVRFDSNEERLFFEWIFKFITQNELPWTIIPQIELPSMLFINNSYTRERGDFLIVHPEEKPILIEIDGLQHEEHTNRDEERDRMLKKIGITVIRIKASDIRNGIGKKLNQLKRILLEGRRDLPKESEYSRIIRWCKYYHQIQLSLLYALRGNWLNFSNPWKIGIVIPPLLNDDLRGADIINLAVNDLANFLFRLARLYGHSLCEFKPSVFIINHNNNVDQEIDVLIGPANDSTDKLSLNCRSRFLISDACFPAEIHAPMSAARPARLLSPEREDVRWFLHYLFRKDDFWEGQWETIKRTLCGLDSVVLLPTGGGKSIAFQLAALLLPGRCLVVDPILSLIHDQIDNLAAVGIDRCIGITSQLATDERELAIQAFKSGHYLFCYVAPERLQTVPFRDALRSLTTNMPISLIAIDEAHCVSEWGHDFRTAYLNIGRITRTYCTFENFTPPLVALTGTASKIVLKDVQRELGITAFDAIISPKTFDRPELRYTILTCSSEEKIQRVLGFMRRLPTDFGIANNIFFRPRGKHTYAGLVFCPHINGPYGVIEQAKQISNELHTIVGIYSGEPPRGISSNDWEEKKHKFALDFKRNRVAILVCTKAFGMGIDKPNIRYTIHIGLPSSIESFYQEAGRAGRDRSRAECAIILSNDDPKRSKYLLSPATSISDIAKIVNSTKWNKSDDIIRALWFHVRAFRGQKAEIDDIVKMLDQLGDIRKRRQLNITWRDPRWGSSGNGKDLARQRAEKSLHRLVVLGIVEDYTIDFATSEFGVRIAGATQEDIAAAYGRYICTYHQSLGEQAEREALALRREPHHEYVLDIASRLINFIYQHIEMARRRSLNEMLQAVINGQNNNGFRRRILDYLEQSEWDERLELIRTSTKGGLDNLSLLLSDIVSPNDANALRAATARVLASYPDIPGLLILRSVTEALSFKPDPDVVRQNLDAALRFSLEKYQLDETEVAVAISQGVVCALKKTEAAELLIRSSLNSSYINRTLIRVLLKNLPKNLALMPAKYLLNQLVRRCSILITKKGGEND